MPDAIPAHIDNLHAARDQLLELLDGMDYCLDWKLEPADWSARQVVYHLLESPPGGLQRILWAAISEEEAIEVWAGNDNITPERASYDLEQVLEDISKFFTSMQEALEAARERDLGGESVLSRYQTSGGGETYTVGALLDAMFGPHWTEHMDQIKALRDALGM